MHLSRRHVRSAAATAVLATAAALLVAVSPARADSQYGAVLAVAAGSKTGASCSGQANEVTPKTWVADGTYDVSADSQGTITDSNDAGDTTTWSASADLSTKVRTSGPVSGTFSGSVAASVDAAQGDGSDCGATAVVATGLTVVVDAQSSGWLLLRVSHPDGVALDLDITDQASSQEVAQQSTDAEAYDGAAWVDAGSYKLELTLSGTADDDSTTAAPAALSGPVSGRFALARPGAARTAATGPGRAMVALGAGVNCTDRQLSAVFTRKAAGLSSAVFVVNGKKQRVVTRPTPGDAVLLRTGPPDLGARVQVVLQGKKKATVTRTYLACS